MHAPQLPSRSFRGLSQSLSQSQTLTGNARTDAHRHTQRYIVSEVIARLPMIVALFRAVAAFKLGGGKLQVTSDTEGIS